MPNRPKVTSTFHYRCDIYRKGAASTDSEMGIYPVDGDYAVHLTDVFCMYSYDVRRTTGEREAEVRQSSTRYMTVFVPFGTDVRSDDIIVAIRDRRGQGVIYNDIDIVAVQPEAERNQIRLVCQERR